MRPNSASAVGVSLRQLFPDARFHHAQDLRVTSCTSDSRKCLPGDLFVALVGDRDDGHDFAQQARERGASGILAEYPVPVAELPVCVVDDTRKAFAALCQQLAGNPSQHIRVIGVTGTLGKTSVSTLLASVLARAGHRVALMNDLETSDWETINPAPRREAGPAEIADWLARGLSNGCTHAVVEVSSRQLARRCFHDVQFDVACLTNVRRAHLRDHGTLANYVRCKERILELLRPEGVVVANADDPGAVRLLDRWPGPALTFALAEPAELSCTVVDRELSEQTFLLTTDRETIPVRTAIVGDHHVLNCLAAITVGLTESVKLSDAVAGVEAVRALPGRLQRLNCGQPFGVFVDQYCFEGSLETCHQTLRPLTRGKLTCVLGAPAGLPISEVARLVSLAERDADELILTSSHAAGAIDARRLAAGARRGHRQGRTRVIVPRDVALTTAMAAAHPGDCILLGFPVPVLEHGPWDGSGAATAAERILRKMPACDQEVRPIVLAG